MSDIKVGDRVRVVHAAPWAPSWAYAEGKVGTVTQLDHGSADPYAVVLDMDRCDDPDDTTRVWCLEVEPVEPEWQVGDSCEVLLGRAWSRGVVHSVRSDECCVTGVPGDGWSTWASLTDMRRPTRTVEPDPVETLRREVEALRTRVISIELAQPVAHVWSDGTVGPTRPLTDADIGDVLSVRAVPAEELARELAAMTERAESAERRLWAANVAALRREKGLADMYHRAVKAESRHAELREAIRAALGEDE